MEYVAIGILVLVALVAGVWAYAMIGTFKKRNQEESESTEADETVLENAEEEQPEEAAPAEQDTVATFMETVKGLRPRRWAFLGICACLVGLAAAKLLVLAPGGIPGMRLAVAAVMLLPAMIVDMNTRLIPNVLVLAMLAVGTVFYGMEFLMTPETQGSMIVSAVVGLLGCFVLFYVMARLTKGGMGMGDVKQLSALGWMVGLYGALVSVLFSLLACMVVAIVLLASKKKKAKDSVPFGPFIFFGYLLAVLICNF